MLGVKEDANEFLEDEVSQLVGLRLSLVAVDVEKVFDGFGKSERGILGSLLLLLRFLVLRGFLVLAIEVNILQFLSIHNYNQSFMNSIWLVDL